jgi:cardiolipin synthase
VGSSNLEHRSLGLDDELFVAVHDPGVVGELVRQFEEDLKVCSEFDLDRWNRRPLHRRVIEAAGDLVRQSL